MVINALNSGANCFMSDFEDASMSSLRLFFYFSLLICIFAASPTWENLVEGHNNLRFSSLLQSPVTKLTTITRDAVNGVISVTTEDGKKYTLSKKPATLFLR
jgi:malate synthase